MEGGGYPGHPVLPEEPLAQARGHHHAGGVPMMRLLHGYSWPCLSANWESQSRSQRRKDPHDEALREAKEVHHLALEAVHMLEQNIERLSQGVESTQYQCPCSHSSSRSLDRHERSLDRREKSLSWHQLERHVIF